MVDAAVSYEEVLAWLFARHRFGMTRTLDTTRRLLEYFGNPQDGIPIIHVAGTNGKGTTCAMLAAVAQAAGYRTGLYTSPHLVDWRERIRINGELAPVELLAPLLTAVRSLAETCSATFFEITTTVAMRAFREAGADFLVIETGLGGSWDSTNLVHPIVAHLTRIDLDHTDILGNTRQAIARDKTGVWKTGAAATSALQTPPVARLLAKRWQERGASSYYYAPLHLRITTVDAITFPVAEESRQLLQRVRIKCLTPAARDAFAGLSEIDLPFAGAHQLENLSGALTALLGARAQGIAFPIGAIATGIGSARFRARFEVLQRTPLVIADAAHNRGSAEALAATLRATVPGREGARLRIVMALLADKDLSGFAAALGELKPVVYAASLTVARGRDGREIVAAFHNTGCTAVPFDTPEAAWYAALRESSSADCIVLTGSHYLIGALLPIVENR